MSTADDRSTRLSLVNGLRDADNHAAWQRFCANYQPRLRKACARFGVRPSDLDDVVAAVLRRVAEAMRDGWVYDPSRSFGGWLTTICRNEALRHLRRANGQAARGGVGTGERRALEALHEVADPEEAVEVEVGWAETVRTAAERVRARVDPKWWECFVLNGIERRPAPEVAARLGVSPDYVWQSKRRVALLIRAEVQTDLSQMGPFGAPDTTPAAEFSPPEGAMARIVPKNAAGIRSIAA
jgi:RNA polymerase sigma factor (sigma-70 family)